jgi:hypothetical protein
MRDAARWKFASLGARRKRAALGAGGRGGRPERERDPVNERCLTVQVRYGVTGHRSYIYGHDRSQTTEQQRLVRRYNLHRKSSYLKRRGVASSTSWFSRVPSRVSLSASSSQRRPTGTASGKQSSNPNRAPETKAGRNRTPYTLSGVPLATCTLPVPWHVLQQTLLTYLLTGRKNRTIVETGQRLCMYSVNLAQLTQPRGAEYR